MSQVERIAGFADAALAGLDTRRFLRALMPVFCDGMGSQKQMDTPWRMFSAAAEQLAGAHFSIPTNAATLSSNPVRSCADCCSSLRMTGLLRIASSASASEPRL